MSFQPVLLWTDLLVWLLVLACAAFGLHVLRTPALRASWHGVLARPMGMGALTVLCAFILIGLLDSVHGEPRVLRDLTNREPLSAHSERGAAVP